MKKLKDLFFLLIRILFSHKTVSKLGLTSLKQERINIVLKYCKGKILDIGCGEGNELIRRYQGKGVGVDVYPWEGVNKVCDTTNLPFDNESFDTITLLATLNHIPEREEVLKECYRVLRKDGKILITMINPILGFVRHKLSWWDKDQYERGMVKGEVYGLWERDIGKILKKANFIYEGKIRFIFGLNKLYIGKKLIKT